MKIGCLRRCRGVLHHVVSAAAIQNITYYAGFSFCLRKVKSKEPNHPHGWPCPSAAKDTSDLVSGVVLCYREQIKCLNTVTVQKVFSVKKCFCSEETVPTKWASSEDRVTFVDKPRQPLSPSSDWVRRRASEKAQTSETNRCSVSRVCPSSRSNVHAWPHSQIQQMTGKSKKRKIHPSHSLFCAVGVNVPRQKSRSFLHH